MNNTLFFTTSGYKGIALINGVEHELIPLFMGEDCADLLCTLFSTREYPFILIDHLTVTKDVEIFLYPLSCHYGKIVYKTDEVNLVLQPDNWSIPFYSRKWVEEMNKCHGLNP